MTIRSNTTRESARKSGQGEPDETYQWNRGADVLSYKQLRRMPRPPWLIEDVLPGVAFSMIYGFSSTGKSLWTLDMALCIATGYKWQGHPVHQVDVLYVTAEGLEEHPKRTAAWAKKHSVRDNELERHFFTYPAPVRLWHDDWSIRFFTDAIERKGIHPGLVVFDTYSACLGGADEKDNGQAREVVDHLDDIRRRWKTAVLVVHHTGSEVGEAALPSLHVQRKKRPRGAQALPDACSMHARLVGDGSTMAQLTCTKQRGAARFEMIERNLHRVELPNDEDCLSFADNYATGPRDTTRERVSWEGIEAVLEQIDAPILQREIADALGIDTNERNRKKVAGHLNRHRDEVYKPEGFNGYWLKRRPLPLSLKVSA